MKLFEAIRNLISQFAKTDYYAYSLVPVRVNNSNNYRRIR